MDGTQQQLGPMRAPCPDFSESGCDGDIAKVISLIVIDWGEKRQFHTIDGVLMAIYRISDHQRQ